MTTARRCTVILRPNTENPRYLTEDGTSEYEWDARGRLSAIAGPVEASFAYDPFGRRVSKSFGETTTDLLYDGPNVVQEYEGETLIASILNGLAPDQLIARTTEAGTESYLTDRLGSAIALADSSKEIATTYAYEPFGAPTSEGEESDNPFGFTGREYDPTSLQYSRARYYDPASARFVSQDPAGLAASGPNLYWYADGSPLDLTDPSGLGPCIGGFIACDEDDDPCSSIASGPMIAFCATPDSLEEPVSDLTAGYGDKITRGYTNKLREALGHHTTVTNSGIYEFGGLLANIHEEALTVVAASRVLRLFPARLLPAQLRMKPQTPRDLPERWQLPPRDLDPLP